MAKQIKISTVEDTEFLSQNIPKTSHALYVYEKERFDLISTTLTAEQELQLQSFLLRRLKKGALYSGTVNFSPMDFSITETLTSPATCFYILLPSGNGCERQLVICFLATSDVNLEVFRLELLHYCEKLSSNISAVKDITSLDMKNLNEWHHSCVQYVCRIIKVLGEDVACLLQLAEQNQNIHTDGVDNNLAEDVKLFLTACSVNECLTSQDCNLPPATLLPNKVVGVKPNSYCKEWSQLILENGYNVAPWKIRRAMEAFKLKTIKDMNMLKRLLKQSETDHYSLYRAYTFLWQSGNSNVLLEHAKAEGGSAPDVITALEEHMRHVTVSCV